MKYYFLGIGGIGMSALARFFNMRGDQVEGYDRTPSPLTQQLESEGIVIHYDDDASQVPSDADMVIYTPAVPQDTAVFQRCMALGMPIKKRSQMLGHLTEGKKCVAVAGSHGKTTTSSLIAHLLSQSPKGCSAFLGGIAKNFNSNVVVRPESDFVVVEADEYDRSFLQLHPFISVVTATDPDHLDIYGTCEKMIEAYVQFVNQTDPHGHLIIKEGLFADAVIPAHHTYTARSVDADYYAVNVRNYNGNIYFDLRTPNKVLYDLQLCQSPLYNVENAVAASAVALLCGLTEEQLRAGLKSFAGIQRRFDYHIRRPDIVYIDDYAHHPQEIAATIESVRYLYPGKRLVGIFQPHLYSRTRDLADLFAEALSSLDEIIVLPIYPARERPIPGVTSAMIVHQIKNLSKYYVTKEQLFDLLPALYPDVVLSMGAGDIDRLVPQIADLLNGIHS
ncbi:MAG: UDP-N-acetylmuramate--L-alanine ligase [Bacteroidales bacterium]|nr:UDP-N-acetylmuramate--L-alanine ligase [Bacteroidales bacterium]